LGGTAVQVFQVDLLGLGKRKPVRQLEKAGVILKLHQHVLAHKFPAAKVRI
jgi:hypothetical protein